MTPGLPAPPQADRGGPAAGRRRTRCDQARERTARSRALPTTPGGRDRRPDTSTVEEPLELRVGRRPLVVTMRTPGHDIELAHGLLLAEGVVSGAADVACAHYRDPVDDAGCDLHDVLDIELAAGVTPPDPGVVRRLFTTSPCGECGESSLDTVRSRSRHSPRVDRVRVAAEVLSLLPDALRRERREDTAGLPAAGLFTATGEPLAVREDVGRHNAVDKVLGWALLQGRIPARETVLMVAGRMSFELVRRAVMAGVPVLAAVSAPSTFAAAVGEEAGLTIVTVVRGEPTTAYTHPWRIEG